MRILIASDVHSNLEALKEALAQASYDEVWILGDLVGYGANPNEVISLIRDLNPTRIVRGNHDKVCSGLEEPTGFSEMAREAALWTRRNLTDSSLDYLRALPEGPLSCGRWLISHGSPRDEDEYLVSAQQFEAQMADNPGQTCFFGHTHIPLIFSRTGKRNLAYHAAQTIEISLENDSLYYINPGSVGQPRDGDSRGSVAVLDTDQSSLRFIRFQYPVEESAEKILQAGLPEYLAHRLLCGL